MIIIGNYFDRVDTPEGLAQYNSMYKIDYKDHIENSGSRGQGDGITILKTPDYRYVARIDYDGEIYQLFVIEDGDEMIVYTDGCMQQEGRVFNSDGHAFFTIKENGQETGTYHVSNSPYDVVDEAWEEMDLSKEEFIKNVKKLLSSNNLPDLISETNIVFVTEL